MVKHDTIEELRRLLGTDAILLACKPGTKKPLGKWKDCGPECMEERSYIEKLRRNNIGVVLGARSGGLCSLDIDSDDGYQEFLGLNPEISETLRTRGARGANIWWRLNSDYPPLTPLKRNDAPWGEWRADGAQTIIHGQHPAGGSYRFLKKASPLRIEFNQIVWPTGISPTLTPSKGQLVTERPERTELAEPAETSERSERMEQPERTDADTRGSVGGLVRVFTIEEVVERAVPTGSQQNHKCLFLLARGIKALEATRGSSLSLPEKRRIFDQWRERAQPFLKKDLNADDYWFEFLEGYENAMSALGLNLAEAAWKQAQQNQPPPEANQFSDVQVRALVGLCREMWRMMGRRPFFLSVRTVQRLFGLNDHMRAARWLRGLQRNQILRVSELGTQKTMKATRYHYLPKVD